LGFPAKLNSVPMEKKNKRAFTQNGTFFKTVPLDPLKSLGEGNVEILRWVRDYDGVWNEKATESWGSHSPGALENTGASGHIGGMP